MIYFLFLYIKNMNLENIYASRKSKASKGDFGYVLIIAGSRIYSGSPIFNAMSALRCGADLVTIAGHKRAMDIAASYAPDIITYPLESEFGKEDIPQIMDLAKKFDALVIGGGMERSEKSFEAIRELIKEINLPMVLDAEAIRAVAKDKTVLRGKQVVFTPNVPEFEFLTGKKAAEDIEERKRQVCFWAKELSAVVALKGNADVISDGDKTLLNRTGNAFMTKGGFGDTLAGICGALLARGAEPLAAAEAACYINGKAGELTGDKFGESLLASDMFDFLPEVIKKETR